MAQYVRLAQGIGAGKVVETPAVVADRYAGGAARGATADGDQPGRPVDRHEPDSHRQRHDYRAAVYLSVNGVKQQVDRDGCASAPGDADGDQQPDRHGRRGNEGGTAR